MTKVRRLTFQPDPSLARLEKLFFPDGLTLEDRVRMGVRAAKLEIEPKYVEILRQMPPGLKVSQAFELWDWAREALYGQGLQHGLSPEEAMRDAARRLLATKNDV
jgi:hypothetical protein